MPTGRVVAAADVAAVQADAQVQPLAASAQAVLAAGHLGGQLGDRDRVRMGAGQRTVPSMGSHTWKVVPPGPVSKPSVPLWCSSTILRAVSRPRPVPRPTG